TGESGRRRAVYGGPVGDRIPAESGEHRRWFIAYFGVRGEHGDQRADWDELRFAVPLRSARLRLGRGLGFGLWFDLVVHRPVDVTAHPAWRDVQLGGRNRRGAPPLTHRPFDLRRGHPRWGLGPVSPSARSALSR